MTDKIRIMAMSDPLNAPTGFGRVARELVERLPRDRYEIAYLSRGWVGSRKFDVQPYSASASDEVMAGAFAVAAYDFGPPFILWTLMDPWQTGWISHTEVNTYSTPASAQWLKEHRQRIRWIGHYPVDGEGLRDGPPYWYEQFLNGPDVTVFMSEFGQRITKPLLSTRTSFISHAVDTKLFYPISEESKAKAKEAAGLGGRHVVLCVMANRRRKYWPEVLQAFKIALSRQTDLHLVAVCGDPNGSADDSWSLVEIATTLGLMGEKPRVTFITAVSDKVLARLYQIASQVVLLSAGEGFGLPQLEAHACGLPCTVGRYSASEELMVDEREGVAPRAWTFEGNNVIKRPVYAWPDVADKILFWARNPAYLPIMAARGWQQAQARSWDNILPAWTTLFEQEWTALTSATTPTHTDLMVTPESMEETTEEKAPEGSGEHVGEDGAERAPAGAQAGAD